MGCPALARDWVAVGVPSNWRVRRITPQGEWLVHRQRKFHVGPFPAERSVSADPLEKAIEESLLLLDAGTAREEDEAPAVSSIARNRAIRFLREHAEQARRLGSPLPVPTISPGPRGGIDLHWKLADFELLLNFPPLAEEPATFYGDNEGKDSVRGTIGSDHGSRSMLPWLIRAQ